MGLRDILKKKDQIGDDDRALNRAETIKKIAADDFIFVRSDTHSQELIHPPSAPASTNGNATDYPFAKDAGQGSKSKLSLDIFHSSSRRRSFSRTPSPSPGSVSGLSGPPKSTPPSTAKEKESTRRRISQRLHLGRTPAYSQVVPSDLPDIVTVTPDGQEDRVAAEPEWEKRATILAKENEKFRSQPQTPVAELDSVFESLGVEADRGHAVSPSHGRVGSQAIDEDIQTAIRLHEEGDLKASTTMFARLADPNGANNPLSQVLYGLALRHGWGCEPSPAAAVDYLSAAASNAAMVENLALQAGLKNGGAAKGELVLAIFELANCFRHGWGIPQDPVAAHKYYETAANLGDTDAMNEVAWCYLEGFGCKKNKFLAAKYYRLAEKHGQKTLGNSWIWKDKYDPGNPQNKVGVLP